LTKPTPYVELRAMGRIDLAAAVPLRAPMAVYVETTNFCNFRCVCCPKSFSDYTTMAGGLHHIAPGAFSMVAQQIRDLGPPRILNFYMMGEPFANRELPAYIAIATAGGLADRTCVTTNGSLLDDRAIDGLLDSGLDYLRVSIYGATQETVARRTGTRFSLARIISNLSALRTRRDQRGRKPSVYIKMIDTRDPAENTQFLRLFAPLGDDVAIEPVMNWNDPEEGSLAQQPREELLASPYFRHVKCVCPFPFYTMVIHADLRVSVCCVDWAKQAVVGDLRSQTLAEIWRGERLRAFQLTHLRGERHSLLACARCTYLHTSPDNMDALSPDEFLGRSA
jgi:MoaA/NifB/PqqE/SkfB family radical SAM enzyme